MKKTIIDDGFSSYLVEQAFFDGNLEIPVINKPEKIVIPQRMVPFSKRKYADGENAALVFYENDLKFRDILLSVDDYIDDLRRFSLIVSPDCSLYRDMPLVLQMANIYMNRAIGVYLQSKGMNIIPNVRWGDERTYSDSVLGEKAAFLGIPKGSIVSIGTYGCVKSREDKFYFREGLSAMLQELRPEIVLVYGAMPKSIFEDFEGKTLFVGFPDWTSSKRKKVD